MAGMGAKARLSTFGLGDRHRSGDGGSGAGRGALADGYQCPSGTDFALATSGVAGPSGGTAAKPVGLVYIGLAGPQGGEFRELRLGSHLSRWLIRDRACSTALNLLRGRLLG